MSVPRDQANEYKMQSALKDGIEERENQSSQNKQLVPFTLNQEKKGWS